MMDAGIALPPGRSPTRPTARSTPTIQRRPDLPRADRRPARGQREPCDRQARLVADHGRARQARGHRPLLRDLRQRDRRLHGHTGPPRSIRRRAALWPRFSRPDHPRHGAGAGGAHRPAGHRQAVLRRSAAPWAACRCCNGRRAIPSGSSRRLPIAAAARHSAQNIAFHEVGRQAIMADPDWRGGNYLTRARARPRASRVARMGAHITYLSEMALHRKFGRNFQDRRRADLLVRRRFPDRELPALSGPVLRRALRRQFVSLRDAGDGLFRSRGGAWRHPGQGVQGIADALLRDLVHVRLAVSDLRFPRHRARAQRGRRPPSPSSRSRATRATTRSCSTSPRCSPPPAASSTRPRAHGDRMTFPRRCDDWKRPRLDFLLLADMVEPGSRVLDVGCGDGACSPSCATASASTGAASRSRARASMRASPRACR